MLYDISQFDKQPFLCVHIDDPVLCKRTYPPRTPIYTSVSFSNDGKWLLVGTSGDVHYVLDSFEGTVVARLECEPAPLAAHLARSLTPSWSQVLLSRSQPAWSAPSPLLTTARWNLQLASRARKCDGRQMVATSSQVRTSVRAPPYTLADGLPRTGSIDGRLHIWDVAPPEADLAKLYPTRPAPGPECTLHPITSFEGHLGGPSRALAFNPRQAMIASAGFELVSRASWAAIVQQR